MTPQLLLESAIRASVLGLGVWCWLKLTRTKDLEHERLLWLGVLLGSVTMPVVATLAHRILPMTTPIISIWPESSAVHGATGVQSLIWLAYLAIVAVLFLRMGTGLFLVSRIWRTATPVPQLSEPGLPVRSSSRIQVPVTIGAGILVPETWKCWSRDVRDRILTHERSHHARGDFAWQLLMHAHLAVFWASPLSWWLLRRVTLLAEHLSDDAALAAHGSPADYAEVLLAFRAEQPLGPVAVGMTGRSQLSRRIARILDRTLPPTLGRRPRVPLIAASLAVALLGAAGPWLALTPTPSRLGPLPVPLPHLEPLEPLGPMR